MHGEQFILVDLDGTSSSEHPTNRKSVKKLEDFTCQFGDS